MHRPTLNAYSLLGKIHALDEGERGVLCRLLQKEFAADFADLEGRREAVDVENERFVDDCHYNNLIHFDIVTGRKLFGSGMVLDAELLAIMCLLDKFEWFRRFRSLPGGKIENVFEALALINDGKVSGESVGRHGNVFSMRLPDVGCNVLYMRPVDSRDDCYLLSLVKGD